MDSQPSLPEQPRRRGLPIWTALVALLTIAIAGLVTLGLVVHHLRNEKVRLARQVEAAETARKRHEVEQQQATENARLLQARNQQDQVLTQARALTNVLLQLLHTCDTLRAEAAALRTNEAGRAVALHPELVSLARRFYESSLPQVPPEAETLTRLEAVRRIQQQVLANYGKAYEPPPALQETVQGASAWASETQLKVEPVRHTLAALAEDSKVRFTRATLTAQSPTLATAIARLQQQESGARLSQADAVVTQARTVADLDLAEAQAQQILADARREAEAIRQRGQEEQAALEREQQEREAQLKVEETKTRLTVQSKEEEARKLGLRKKASDPATLAKLAPFITPGYAGIYKPTYDKKPFSFSEMQSLGALAPTVEGLDLVAGIGVARIDTVRPRWKLNPRTYRRYPDQLEMVREAQQLLIELGPVLVEMGKLEP